MNTKFAPIIRGARKDPGILIASAIAPAKFSAKSPDPADTEHHLQSLRMMLLGLSTVCMQWNSIPFACAI